MTTQQRLEELLEAKDEQIEQLRAEKAELARKLALSPHLWSVPTEITEDQTLPVPRIEVRVYLPEDDHEFHGSMKTVYRLVIEDPVDGLLSYPLGVSVRSGPGYGGKVPRWQGGIDASGAYTNKARALSTQLSIPAFVCWRDEAEPITPTP